MVYVDGVEFCALVCSFVIIIIIIIITIFAFCYRCHLGVIVGNGIYRIGRFAIPRLKLI